MQLKNLMGNRARENPSHVKFRTQLEAAVRSVTPGTRVEPAAVEGMLALVRSKEISPGDALSCFKTYFREGSPDEQLKTLKVLVQFVDTDTLLASQLHSELASKRWRERFVLLAGSAHPEVRPMLVSTMQSWINVYLGHDIGMHYQNTLRELTGNGGSFRPAGPGYSAQYTGYSTQQTGYSTQATGAAYPMPPPSPGYPMPSPPGYPAPAAGYPPYGPPYPPPQQQGSRQVSDTVAQKLEQLVSEVEVLRGAIHTFETTLADYKAQRCSFAALSSAMEKGQRSADRCTSLQSQMEGLLGNSDADEALMTRVFSTNDAVMASLEHWGRLSNQELAPDDAQVASTSAGPSTSTAGGSGAAVPPPPPPPPPPARPPPTPLDLLLGDEIPSPAPPLPLSPPVVPHPAAAVPTGATEWNAFPALTAAPAAAPQPQLGTEVAGGTVATAGSLFAALGVTSGPSVPIVPASDAEGLRSQVLSLAAELEKERRLHKTALDTQEAFHKQELAKAQARISELEGALARQPSLQLLPSAGASTGLGQPGPAFGSAGGSAPVPAALSTSNPFASPLSSLPSYGAMLPPPPMGPGGGLFTPMPAAAVPPPPPQLPAPLGAAPTPPAVTLPPPFAAAAAPGPAAAADILSAFDGLAVLSPKSTGGAPPVPAAVPAPPAAFGSAAGPGGAGGASGPWVNFGH